MSSLLFVLSSPSGGGKSSLAKAIINTRANFSLSISFTTRAPRPGEIEGVDYHFVSQAQFKTMEENGDLLEVTNLLGNYYATSKKQVHEFMVQGQHIIFDIDPYGAKNVKQQWPDSTISIFILPPSLEVLQERLIARNQDSMEVISQRMIKAQEVMSFAQDYDYQIVNNIFEDSLQQILNIIDQNIASKSNQEIKRYTYFKF
jgi:guanylate kinase